MLQFDGASSFGADPNRHARRIFAWDVSKVYCDPNNLGCSPMDGMFGGTALRNDECSKALIFEAWQDAGAPTASAFMNAYGGEGNSDESEDWSDAVCKAFEVEECSAERSEHNGEIADTLGDGNPATCCTVDMGDGTFDPPSSASYGKVVAPPYHRYFMAPGGENCPAGTMITTHDECRVAAAALGRNPATWRTYTAANVDATFRQRSVAMWLTVVDGKTDAGAIAATGASTVTDATSFTIPNDPATTWPVMEGTWFNQNAKHAGDWNTNCGSSCTSHQIEYYYSSLQAAIDACVQLPWECCTGIVHRNAREVAGESPWNPKCENFLHESRNCISAGGEELDGSDCGGVNGGGGSVSPTSCGGCVATDAYPHRKQRTYFRPPLLTN